MDIILQNVVGVFLKNGNDYLLMKRSPNKKIAPNKYSPIGGHIEPFEFNSPYSAAKREVLEESNIKEENIFNLELKYILTRHDKNIIRQNYIFFGETNQKEVTENEEGKLYWVHEDDVINKDFTLKYKEMVKHHFLNNKKINDIIVGVAENYEGKLKMNFIELKDYE